MQAVNVAVPETRLRGNPGTTIGSLECFAYSQAYDHPLKYSI